MAEPKIHGVYISSLLTRKIHLPMSDMGRNVKQMLEDRIMASVEGKCVAEGFIKPGTVHIQSYSSGNVSMNQIEFHATFECMVCHPVEGMLLECESKNITKAGIHAKVIDANGVIPITVFIARDHHNTYNYFSTIKENMKIVVSVIGVRFELDDPYICVIGRLSGGGNLRFAP
jgi:DNA-directed RNA polymerase subunit E'/Rpb7